ncbi:MAG: hypothetical protein ABSE04_04275 [Candidatus Microgenomates bacterium]|jgi:hypothetical protein
MEWYDLTTTPFADKVRQGIKDYLRLHKAAPIVCFTGTETAGENPPATIDGVKILVNPETQFGKLFFSDELADKEKEEV